ncbi:MAG: ATP synthase F1 subunit gamma [Clostridia bacterium]|nr:ATP synthase F1 subunit gamma [Clostridia bacterium]
MSDMAALQARITSVSETKKVTDAMNRISSVKMTRAKREVENTATYFRAIKEEIGELFRHIPETTNRYFKVPAPDGGGHRTHGILLVTSDKGLAGAYNKTAIGVAESVMARHPETVLFIVGEYGRQHFASRGLPFVEDFLYSAQQPTVWKARQICTDLLAYYDSGRVDEINIIYTDFKGGRVGQCKRNILLPLDRSRFATDDARAAREVGEDEKAFFPDPDSVLMGVVPSYLTGFIYSSLVDSYCSEQQARMMAMSAASHNAEEMLRELRLRRNRMRQAAITREITEITSGARAIRRMSEAHSQGGETVNDR